MASRRQEYADVVIVGAGLAGLSLARHLLLESDATVMMIDRRDAPPGPTQKVGESLVQVGGYYFSKVLDLEEYLLRHHYLKFNLRFYWKTPGLQNTGFEDYSKAYTGKLSDIANFQLDRNKLEANLIEAARQDARFRFVGGVEPPEINLSDDGEHRVRFSGREVRCGWVVDCTGRAGLLKKKLGLRKDNPIRHGATWCWVDGLVDVERLTDRSRTRVRKDPQRQQAGHFPVFLATNHFCAEGRWFWVIPLHGKTSLGLVYDRAIVDPKEVADARKMMEYVCREWPLFARDLPRRTVLDQGRLADYSYDAEQTISPSRWAVSGVAGRFSDPLYSPGSDLIAFHNTLIVDAIKAPAAKLKEKCESAERLMKVLYEAYVPSFSVSYNCLGDQECFTLKYGWELAVYFGFYVFPFVNDLLVEPRFVPHYLRKLGLLGPLNRALQQFLSDYYQWKKEHGTQLEKPHLNDFYEMQPVAESADMFYDVGLSVSESLDVLDEQYQRLRQFARFIVAHVHAVVVDDRAAVENAAFVRSLKLRTLRFDPEAMRAAYAPHASSNEKYTWNLDPLTLESFLPKTSSDPHLIRTAV